MRAVVYEGPDDIRLDEVPEPVIQDPGDAIVRVTTTSICGSDLHILHGLLPKMEPGSIIGHEFAGVVHEVGDGGHAVQAGRPGGRRGGGVVRTVPRLQARPLQRLRARRHLRPRPAAGRPAGRPGRLRAGALLPTTRCSRSRRLPDDQVIFAGDILPTAIQRWRGSPRAAAASQRVTTWWCSASARWVSARWLRPGSSSPRAGSSRSTCSAERLALAERLGADVVIDAADRRRPQGGQATHRRLGRRLRGRGRGQGKRLWTTPYAWLRPGGVVSVVGAFQQPITINAPRMQAKNVTMAMGMGDLGTMPELVQGHRGGQARRDSPIVTHRMSLDDAIQAYEVFDKRLEGAIKILLTTWTAPSPVAVSGTRSERRST